LIFKSDPILSILKYKWNLSHTNNIAKNKIVLGKKKINLQTFCFKYVMNQTPYLSLSGNPSENTLRCFWLDKKTERRKKRSPLNWKRKTFTKQNLISLIYPRFSPKIETQGIPSCGSTEFRGKQTKSGRPKVASTWTFKLKYQTKLKKTWQPQRLPWHLFF